MKFHINSDFLLPVLKKIDKTGAIDSDNESYCSIMIESNNPAGQSELKFVVRNAAFIAIFEINDEDFKEYDDKNKDHFLVSDQGKVYVDGKIFTSVLKGYPSNSILQFELKESASKKKKDGVLRVNCKRSKGKIKRTDFNTIKIKTFEEKPPDEKRDKLTINNIDKLTKAVNDVSFTSGVVDQEDANQYLCGCYIEIENDDIFAVATNRKAMCSSGDYDSTAKAPYKFLPVMTYFISALSNLDKSAPADFEVGERYTFMKQGGQSYYIPNAGLSDRFPEWRSVFTGKISSKVGVIRLSREALLDCIKTSEPIVGSDYGINIDVNTDNKEVIFTSSSIDSQGSLVRASHTEVSVLEDSNFTGTVKCEVLLPIYALKEILKRIKETYVNVIFLGSNKPVLIEGDQTAIKYLLTPITIGS